MFSPRARGCSVRGNPRPFRRPVFPACAGMFRCTGSLELTPIRFPRVRGDVPSAGVPSRVMKKFSPRARGCSYWPEISGFFDNVFPACAGMFRFPDRWRSVTMRFPRVRGDVPNELFNIIDDTEFSPRARGCSYMAYDHSYRDRVFPACAGMFRTINEPVINCKSFSPRARGCSAAQGLSGPFDEVFPACAGMFPT